jgi:lipopolysaccharide transport system ATP-binding protein
MYVRLAFAVAAHLEPEILIVDEVLAVGDVAFQQKCLGKMNDVATQGRTVLLVSHDISAIRRLCNRGLVLSNGQYVCYKSIDEAIEEYEELVLGRKKQKSVPSAPHIIYEVSGKTGAEFEITKIEILDSEGNPKDQVCTWDSFIMRVHYEAFRRVDRGAVEIRVASRDNTRLLNLSTQPDSAIPMVIEVGRHIVDCRIQSVPLSAGEYLVSAALTIPNEKWLLELETLGHLTIHPRDVFNSTMPPASSRAFLAVPHNWKILNCTGR